MPTLCPPALKFLASIRADRVSFTPGRRLCVYPTPTRLALLTLAETEESLSSWYLAAMPKRVLLLPAVQARLTKIPGARYLKESCRLKVPYSLSRFLDVKKQLLLLPTARGEMGLLKSMEDPLR